MEENKPWYKKWWGVILLILFTISLILIVAFGFFVISIIKNTDNIQEKTTTSTKDVNSTIITGTDNYWTGSAHPQITIVEFGDFACHYCAKSFSTIREISTKYKKDVKIIFRDYPVISEHSSDLSLSARCAGEQGLFWLMYDKLFLNQGVGSKEELIGLAKQIGADTEKFTACFDSQKYLPDIQKDYADGQSLNITGTPTWFINGQKIAGDIPLNNFEEIINNIIKK